MRGPLHPSQKRGSQFPRASLWERQVEDPLQSIGIDSCTSWARLRGEIEVLRDAGKEMLSIDARTSLQTWRKVLPGVQTLTRSSVARVRMGSFGFCDLEIVQWSFVCHDGAGDVRHVTEFIHKGRLHDVANGPSGQHHNSQNLYTNTWQLSAKPIVIARLRAALATSS